jgi:hypothetical protein
MSYVVGTGTVAFSRGKDRPCGVEVTACGKPAGCALEGSDTQSEAKTGSLVALGAGHRGVGGRNQHHLPAAGNFFVGLEAATSAVRRVIGGEEPTTEQLQRL